MLRLFEPKYYASSKGGMQTVLDTFYLTDKSRVSCARRGDVYKAEEDEFLSKPAVQRYQQGEHWDLYDLVPEQVQEFSSTKARAAFHAGRVDEARMICGSEICEYIQKEGLYKL